MMHVSQVLNNMWKTKIATDGEWALRAAQRITAEYRENPRDGIGFNRHDKDFVMGVVDFHMVKGYITGKQAHALMKTMPRYVDQLVGIVCDQDKRDEAPAGDPGLQVP